jgi:O-antigen ligase
MKDAALADEQRGWLAFTSVWTLGGVLLYLFAPQTSPGLLILSVVAPLLWYAPPVKVLLAQRPTPVTITLALAACYFLVNASWSLAPGSAYTSVALLVVFIVTLHFTLAALQEVDESVLRAIGQGFFIAMVVGSAFICIEVLDKQWVRRLLMSYIPWLRPDPRNMRLEGDWVTVLSPSLLNRSTTALVLLFWPAVLVVQRLGRTARARALMLLALTPAAIAIFRSAHATSKIAFGGALAAWALFMLSATFARRLTLAVWTAATLLVVPMAMLAYAGNLHLAPWLAESARHRVVIWGYTGEQIAKAPILGAGMSTARALNDPTNPNVPRAPGTDFKLSTGLHSHNGYLQTWFEGGAVGALLLFALGLAILRWLALAPQSIQPYVYPVFVSSALIGSSSFSLWAPWFMASFGFAVVLAAVGVELAAAQGRYEPGRY